MVGLQTQVQLYDFTRFPKLNQSLIDVVDQMLAVDISKLMKMLPREEAVAKDRRIKGGAFGFTDNDPFSQHRDLTKPSTYPGQEEGWLVNQDAARYEAIFEKLGPNAQGKLTGSLTGYRNGPPSVQLPVTYS